MPINPFSSYIPSTAGASVSGSAPVARGGMAAEDRAQSIKDMALDVNTRLARIKTLHSAAIKMQNELQSGQQVGSSRIAYLARQLNKDF